MPRFDRTAALCLLLSVCAAANGEDFVLLRNGNVMTGQAHHESDRVRLRRDGSEFWFDNVQVATIAPTLLAVYVWQRRQVSAPTPDDHLRLAGWCVEQEMFPQASRELLDARALAPHDPRVAALERRLMQAAYPVQTASHVTDTPQRRRLALTDAQVDELPPGALEEFTRQIQPLLLNNCTRGGCHQSGGEREFQLDRALMHGIADRRSTRTNLAAVLEAIDRESPRASPLLRAANEPHAGRSTAAFTGRHAPLGKRLESWTLAVGAAPVQRDSAQSEPGRGSGGVFDLVKAQRERDRFVQQTGAKQAPRGLRDEFDPRVFNRRYRTR